MTHFGRRLSEATMGDARRAVRPAYERCQGARIVHIGVGAFVRGHFGVYADDLLQLGWPATIRGVSLRHSSAQELLTPQDGLYTVEERQPGQPDRLRIIGSFTSVQTGEVAAAAALADPRVQLVTVTVTEKGYETAGTGPLSLAEVLARGLAGRRDAGSVPPVVASLDNLSGNGAILRRAVVAAAEEFDRSLGAWICDRVAFPCSVVDRIVPATTAPTLQRISETLGMEDRAAVTTERYRSWVIEECAGLPPLSDVGVTVVADAAPFERRKLWLLNCPHSAVAYAGLVAGCATIADAIIEPAVGRFVQQIVSAIVEVSDLPATLDAAGFARQSLDRFSNPALGHTCRQVAEDGSRKLQQRLFPVVAIRRERRLPTQDLAFVVAAWIAAVAEVAVAGRVLPEVADPAAAELRRLATGPSRLDLVNRAVGGRVPEGFEAEVVEALRSIETRGVEAFGGQA